MIEFKNESGLSWDQIEKLLCKFKKYAVHVLYDGRVWCSREYVWREKQISEFLVWEFIGRKYR
jgi:hypothetical protein